MRLITYFKHHKDFLFILIGSLVLCLIGSGAYPIYILDEAKNAEAAREMLMNSEFIVPTFNGVLRTDKPPLHYYFMMIGYKLFGINAFGARFFSGIFGALTISSSFYFITKFSKKTLAFIFTGICWSSIFFIQEFHLAVPDPYLIFFISTALWLFYDFYKTESEKSLWLFYVAIGLGTLTKGPVAIALPGLICLLFLIITKKLSVREVLKYKPFLGLIVLLMVVLPWYVMVHLETAGAWSKGFFLDHNLTRFETKMEGHGGVFLITWAFVLLGLMPFSFFIINASKNAYANRKKDTLLLFATLVSLVFITFFSISGTKLPNYTMPCYPFLALVIAMALRKFYDANKKNMYTTIVMILITVISIALPIAGKFALQQEKELADMSDVAYWLCPTAVISSVGLILYFRNEFKKAFITISSGWILLGPILFLVIYPKLTLQNPIEKARSVLKETDNIVVFKRFDAAFPVNFQRTFDVIHTQKEVASFFKENPKGFLLTNERNVDSLNQRTDIVKIFEVKALFESHTTRMYCSKSKNRSFR